MSTFVYPQLWLSEALSGLIFTLGALIIWTFIKRHNSGLDSKWKIRMFAGLALVGVTMASMFGGMIVSNGANDFGAALPGEGGHGWGNPALSMGLAMSQPIHVFADWHVLVLGIFYVIFQFVGAACGLFIYVIYVWIHNSTTSRQENLIRLTQMWRFDTTHPARAFAKDGVATFFVAFAFVGATLLGTDLPEAFPSDMLMRFTSVMATSFAMMSVVMMFGERMIITINPIVWFAAFILKFASQILNNQKMKFQFFLSEFASPIATLGAGMVVGLMTFGIINLPHTVDLDGGLN